MFGDPESSTVTNEVEGSTTSQRSEDNNKELDLLTTDETSIFSIEIV